MNKKNLISRIILRDQGKIKIKKSIGLKNTFSVLMNPLSLTELRFWVGNFWIVFLISKLVSLKKSLNNND